MSPWIATPPGAVAPGAELIVAGPRQRAVSAWARVVDTRELGWPVRTTLLQRDRKATVLRLQGSGGATLVAKGGAWTRMRAEVAAYRDVSRHAPELAPRLRGWSRDGERGWIFVDAVVGRSLDRADHGDRQRLAAWLAALHRASPRLEHVPRAPRREPVDMARTRVDARIEGLQRRLASSPPALRDELEALLALVHAIRCRWSVVEAVAGDAPAFLVHGDLTAENAFVTACSQRVVVIDWEDAAVGSPLVDLAWSDTATYLALAGDLWPPAARSRLAEMQRIGRVLETVRHRIERKPRKKRRRYLDRLRRQCREAGLA